MLATNIAADAAIDATQIGVNGRNVDCRLVERTDNQVELGISIKLHCIEFGKTLAGLDVCNRLVEMGEMLGQLVQGLDLELGFQLQGNVLEPAGGQLQLSQGRLERSVTLSDLSADLLAYKNRDLTLAGIVTEAQEGISKTGKNFASMVLTDYNGAIKIMLFGNDYVSFSKFCRKGLFLIVRGRVSERWSGTNEFEFKPSKMELLEELASKAEHLTLDIPLDRSDMEWPLYLYVNTSSKNGICLLRT